MMDAPDSGASTPNDSRFTSQAVSVEDRLKADTVGLVTLDDFRKRRAEALEAADGSSASGATTPDLGEVKAKSAFKKRKKIPKKGGLSFGGDDEEDVDAASNVATPGDSRSQTPAIRHDATDATDSEALSEGSASSFKKKSLRPNAGVSLQPKAMTKSAMLKEAHLKEQLRREYIQMQEAVKATEFMLPFVFYDGKNVPGGMVRLKKGDKVWLFLERARKVGADLAGKGDKSRRDWARISVDDLMIVKGDLIIPHHQDFHYFILNKTVGYVGGQLFDYSAEPTLATPKDIRPPSKPTSKDATPEPAAKEDGTPYLQTAAQRKQQASQQTGPPDSELEGYDDDPNATKVVDRRWYEKNKHIYPASTWEDFDPTREYSSGVRKDRDGNAMFFSR